MEELTLEEIHAGTTEILRKLISICDDIGVNYYLAFGSLIGAVRHKGFIPWDDDLDIMMLRPDYERFREYCIEHEAEISPFRFFDFRNTPDYPYALPRFCDTRYRMERDDSVPTAGQGMFIDIYILDGAGDGKNAIKIQKTKKKYTYLLDLSFSTSPVPGTRSKLLTPIKFPAFLYAHLRGPLYFIRKLDAMKNWFSLEDSEYVCCMVWDDAFFPIKREYFTNYEILEFEKIPVKVPNDYNKFLVEFYGDYMQLPPEENRHPHHGYRLYRK